MIGNAFIVKVLMQYKCPCGRIKKQNKQKKISCRQCVVMPKTQQQQQQQDSEIREDRDHISIKKHFTSATANWLSLLKGNEKKKKNQLHYATYSTCS